MTLARLYFAAAANNLQPQRKAAHQQGAAAKPAVAFYYYYYFTFLPFVRLITFCLLLPLLPPEVVLWMWMQNGCDSAAVGPGSRSFSLTNPSMHHDLIRSPRAPAGCVNAAASRARLSVCARAAAVTPTLWENGRFNLLLPEETRLDSHLSFPRGAAADRLSVREVLICHLRGFSIAETPERLHYSGCGGGEEGVAGQAGRRVSLSGGGRTGKKENKVRKKQEKPEGKDGLCKRLDGELGHGQLCLHFVRHAT